jgi:hypothetical protein
METSRSLNGRQMNSKDNFYNQKRRRNKRRPQLKVWDQLLLKRMEQT